MSRIILTTTLMAILISMASFVEGNEPKGEIKLTFVDHLQAGLIEQDVYVEKVPGSGKVFRILPSEREKYLDFPVYKTAKPVHHDPFDQANCGPYKKGKALGFTLSQWLGGRGTGTLNCEEGWGTFKAEFENLIPNATYTMWHFFMSAPPTSPFNGTLDVPLGDRDGKQSTFKTDKHGKATLDVRFEQCLQLSNVQLMSGMAIALHSDGKTYGAIPGDFGTVTHVQLFAMLPDVDDVDDVN